MWINPFEQLPEPGQIVWVLLQHWKEDNPQSYEIYAGEVFKHYDGTVVVENNDYIGLGTQIWKFDGANYHDCNNIYAWAPKDAILIPKFLAILGE